MVRRGRLPVLVAAALVLAVVLAAVAMAATGALTQKPGPAGCITYDAGDGCALGVKVHGTKSVALSPDGTSAYAAAMSNDAVIVFDRDAATGQLTQKPGTAGCISQSGSGGECAVGAGLDGAQSVTVSADGENVYAASFESDAIAVFDRDTTTGALVPSGCISDSGGAGCADGVALDNPTSVAVSPDGRSVYAASRFGDAVAVLDRDTTTGALAQKPGDAGCISKSGTSGACRVGLGLRDARSVAVSPDGLSVYVASNVSHGLAVLDRGGDGSLTQKAGAAGCITDDGVDGSSGFGTPDPVVCTAGHGLRGAQSVAVSPDGKTVYAASSSSSAVTIFDRGAGGALSQKPGTAGCITGEDDGLDGGASDSAPVCTLATGLDNANSVTVSPDGTSVYATAAWHEAVVVFDRNTTSGGLTQKAGTAGCISDGDAQGCGAGAGLDWPESVAVSADAMSVYVGSSDGVAVFDRDDLPDTTITSGPEGTTEEASPSFAFASADPGAVFECRLDAGAFAPCSSPKSYTDLPEGAHTFQVRVTDGDGKTEDPAAERTFTVVAPPAPDPPPAAAPPAAAPPAVAPPVIAPPVVPPAVADTTLQALARTKKAQRQKGKRIKVMVAVRASEDVVARAIGKIKRGKRAYRLKPVSRKIASGRRGSLRLAPRGRKAHRQIRRALKRRKKVTAKLKVTMTDAAGNRDVVRRKVKLKR